MSFQNLLKKVERAADKPEIVTQMQDALCKSQLAELSTQSSLDALRNENATLKGLLKECVKHFEASCAVTSAVTTATPTPAKPTAPISNLSRIEQGIRLELEKNNLLPKTKVK